jgi:hypothetical protein
LALLNGVPRRHVPDLLNIWTCKNGIEDSIINRSITDLVYADDLRVQWGWQQQLFAQEQYYACKHHKADLEVVGMLQNIVYSGPVSNKDES